MHHLRQFICCTALALLTLGGAQAGVMNPIPGDPITIETGKLSGTLLDSRREGLSGRAFRRAAGARAALARAHAGKKLEGHLQRRHQDHQLLHRAARHHAEPLFRRDQIQRGLPQRQYLDAARRQGRRQAAGGGVDSWRRLPGRLHQLRRLWRRAAGEEGGDLHGHLLPGEHLRQPGASRTDGGLADTILPAITACSTRSRA